MLATFIPLQIQYIFRFKVKDMMKSQQRMTLNISGGGKIIFGGADSSATFNINGEIYHVDGKTFLIPNS